MRKSITSEVTLVQKSWARYILKIGESYRKNENFENITKSMIEELYKFSNEEIVFKPTLAKETNFRFTLDEVLSYFLGNDKNFPEDKGFAIKEWTDIIFNNLKIKRIGNYIISVGLYYFVDKNNTKLKVEYTFIYEKDKKEGLKIVLHHSSLPFSG